MLYTINIANNTGTGGSLIGPAGAGNLAAAGSIVLSGGWTTEMINNVDGDTYMRCIR
jgi:hypothetical protein